jgi:hypothetical protein
MACGLDPKVNDASLDADDDGLNNLTEYLHGANPCSKNSDGDQYDDYYEVVTDRTRDPAIHEEPLVYMVMPPVAAVGETITIIGNRLGLHPFTSLTALVYINGVIAPLLAGSTENMLYVHAPNGAQEHSTTLPGLIIHTIYDANFQSEHPYPIKITGPKIDGSKETHESSGGFAEIAPGATIVYGLHLPGESDGYRLHLAGRSVVNVMVRAYGPIQDGDSASFSPVVSVMNKAGDLVKQAGLKGTATVSMNEVVLPGDTAYISVGAPAMNVGDTAIGFYRLGVTKISAPYITAVRPGIGANGESITIEGANFGNTKLTNQVWFMEGNTIHAASIQQGNTTSLTVQVPPDLPGKKGDAFPIVINNLINSLSSTAAEASSHNSQAVFYRAVPGSITRESVFSATALQDGQTVTGFTGPERGHFAFFGEAGRIIEATLLFADSLGNILVAGQPSVVLIDPDGATVDLRPAGWSTLSEGIAHDRYALPRTGIYQVKVSGVLSEVSNGLYYRLSYQRIDPPDADRISVMAGSPFQELVAPKNGSTVFETMQVLLTNDGATATPVVNAPVIFAYPGREKLVFTNVSGLATMIGLQTPAPDIQGEVIAYPGGNPNLRVKYQYLIIEGTPASEAASLSSPAVAKSSSLPSGPSLINSVDPSCIPYRNYPLDDSDHDGLFACEEIVRGTACNSSDTDHDGISDLEESRLPFLDPLNFKDKVKLNITTIKRKNLNDLLAGETISITVQVRDEAKNNRWARKVALQIQDVDNMTDDPAVLDESSVLSDVNGVAHFHLRLPTKVSASRTCFVTQDDDEIQQECLRYYQLCPASV